MMQEETLSDKGMLTMLVRIIPNSYNHVFFHCDEIRITQSEN